MITNMEESIDVKALRARFNNKASTSDTSSSKDSSSPKSPRPGFGRAIIPVTESDMAHHRLPPSLHPPLTGPGMIRFPKAEPLSSSIPSRPPSFPQPPPSSGVRTSLQLTESKVKQTGEMLQNMILRNQRPLGTKPALVPAQASAPPATSSPRLLQRQHRQRSTGEVTPLRKPLPPEGRLPLKPKRPPSVNLEPYRRINRGPALPTLKKIDTDSPSSSGRKMFQPTMISPPKLPQRSNKPSQLPHQIASIDIEDNQETYDDIGSFERNESWSDNDLQCVNEDDDVYEFVDEDQVGLNQVKAEMINKKEAIKHHEQKREEKLEQQKKEKLLRKNFLLQGEIEVLHTAKVQHDWQGGGKLDLSVRQGESVEILRVKNNPEGKWLARSLNGDYGYISNTCVSVDYEAVKRKLLQSKKIDTSLLPPPPPDPPQMLNMDFNNSDSMTQEDDDYDDVQQITEEFPPPPPEVSIDPKVEKELRKKFKYEGPFRVLHTMMVDPNSIIKKPGGKDLHVSQGDILDVIQFTNSKKALCRNRFGKYGFVARSLLLPMEGDIYDDVDHPSDVYDNDSLHTDY